MKREKPELETYEKPKPEEKSPEKVEEKEKEKYVRGVKPKEIEEVEEFQLKIPKADVSDFFFKYFCKFQKLLLSSNIN